MRFFLDTADVDYIKNLLGHFATHGVEFQNIAGVTTNPNAMSKVGATSFEQFVKQTREVVALMESITDPQYDIFLKEVFVQIPRSDMTTGEIIRFVDFCIENLQSENVAVGIKIPPYPNVLNNLDEIFTAVNGGHGAIFNVTGVADAGTALMALSYPEVEYVSIIPGRMKEVGIDYAAHCVYPRLACITDYQKLIAGSMRTVDQVFETVSFGMIPTIGTRVWDIFEEEDFVRLNDKVQPSGEQLTRFANGDYNFAPLTSQANTDLSLAFFEQMDNLGTQLYEEMFKS